jgi:homoserine dehydrogenase
LKVILLGFGFIGRNLVKTLNQKIDFIKKADSDFRLVGVGEINGYLANEKGINLKRLTSIEGLSEYDGGFFEEGSSIELIEQCEADIIIEVTPTNIINGEPGLTNIKKALEKKMHVVTANKGPLVVAFRELTNLARENSVKLKYEATVAGALPIFSLVQKCLQGNKILKISGILNGTANYILSKMYFEGTDFELALKEAQERGITEKDPSYDIDGIDAACKLVILSNSIMNRDYRFDEVKRIGIGRITPEAVSLAKRSGYAIKLIGTVDKTLEVVPKLIPENHPLCVHGTLNALHFETDLAHGITLVGHGAGKETISALTNDIITIIKETNA